MAHRVEVLVDDKQMSELRELVGINNGPGAVHKAIDFTLLHDKDSVMEALKNAR